MSTVKILTQYVGVLIATIGTAVVDPGKQWKNVKVHVFNPTGADATFSLGIRGFRESANAKEWIQKVAAIKTLEGLTFDIALPDGATLLMAAEAGVTFTAIGEEESVP